MENAVMVRVLLPPSTRRRLSAKVPGRVRSITVDLGSVVRKGQVIAQLDTEGFAAQAPAVRSRARPGAHPAGTLS